MLHRSLVTIRRRLALDRNPMRRRADRWETWLSALVVLALLVAAPLLGTRIAGARRADQQAQARASPTYRVTATVGPNLARGGTEMAGPRTAWNARWTAPDGTPHRGAVNVPYGTPADRTVPIWTDAHGRLRAHPATTKQMTANAVAFGGFAGFGIVLGGLGVLWAAHRLLDRRRFADWDARWDRTAPRWMRQY